MSDEQTISRLERRLEREKLAREEVENLLEEKTREVYQANQNLLEQNQELGLLFEISKLTNEDGDSGQMLQAYIEAVCQHTKWPVGHIYLVTKKNDETFLTPTSLWEINDSVDVKEFVTLTEKSIFKPAEGLPGRVYKKQAPLWIEDVFTDNNVPRAQAGKDIGLHGAFGIPIFRYKEIYAIAEFFSEKPQEKNQSLIKIAEVSGRQLKTVLERRFSENQIAENYEKLEAAHKELQSTQAQLVQSSKLASIGQLAAGVAHEINNPISFVNNNTQVMKTYAEKIKGVLDKTLPLVKAIGNESEETIATLKEDAEKTIKKSKLDFILGDLSGLIDDSIEGMDRVTNIIKGLKTFSRVDDAEIQEADLNEGIESTLKVIWNEIKYKCTINKELGDIPHLKCNASQLNQVFMNIIVNGAHAIEEKGELTIRTTDESDHIIVSISDNGSGISEENLEKLFDPFFTTKPVGVGTGLGLSISYGIIQDHGGDIIVDSKLGEGTTFTIKLPKKGIEEQTAGDAPSA